MAANPRPTSLSPKTQATIVKAGSARRRTRLPRNGRDAIGISLPHIKKDFWLIEINWGQPHFLVTSPEGDVQKFSTIEKVKYWLQKRWPIADEARLSALQHVEAAMDCVAPVELARRAFVTAAISAGFISNSVEAY